MIKLTSTQEAALETLREGLDTGYLDTSGIRKATYRKLRAAGLIDIEWGEVQESFRPSRYGFTSERWSRRRTVMKNIRLTEAGREYLNTHVQRSR
jgi:DNA-binding PadR family transcriptional regulator